MFNCESFSLFALLCYCVSGFPLNATVDQRQTGKFNIQFNIKDVAIIFQKDSMWGTNVGDDISYDYDYYDYDHLTVKPDSWGTFNGTKPSKPPIYITSTKPPSPNKPLGTVTILGTEEPPASSTSSTEKTTTTTTSKYAWNGNLEQIPVAVIVDPVVKRKKPTVTTKRRTLQMQDRERQNVGL